MDINSISVIGLIAGTCTTFSFLPQVLKIIKTKETKDLSLPMYAVLTSGLILWTTYGILIRDLPIVFTNAISLGLAVTILMLKIKYG